MMKSILLLGGYGFIGTNILKYIDSNRPNGFKVIVFDRFQRHPCGVDFKCVEKTYAGDFSDGCLLKKVFDENTIDIVIHSLSASVPSSSQDNEFDIKFNVIPTIGLLNQMVQHHVKNIVFISSGGAIYGDHYVNSAGHREGEVLFPKSAYGISKLVIEKYLYLYSIHHGVRSLVLRLSNPYGLYHYSQKQGIINIAIERALYGQPFEIWGDGNGKKDYIFVEDFCAILFGIINRWHEPYAVFNIGSGQLLSVNEIVCEIKESVCHDFEWKYRSVNKLDVHDFRLDLSMQNNIIGDFSFTSFKEGVSKIMDWLKNR